MTPAEYAERYNDDAIRLTRVYARGRPAFRRDPMLVDAVANECLHYAATTYTGKHDPIKHLIVTIGRRVRDPGRLKTRHTLPPDESLVARLRLNHPGFNKIDNADDGSDAIDRLDLILDRLPERWRPALRLIASGWTYADAIKATGHAAPWLCQIRPKARAILTGHRISA